MVKPKVLLAVLQIALHSNVWERRFFYLYKNVESIAAKGTAKLSDPADYDIVVPGC